MPDGDADNVSGGSTYGSQIIVTPQREPLSHYNFYQSALEDYLLPIYQ